MNGWEYLLPRGTTSSYIEPLRWADFRGYYAIAQPIVTGYVCPTSATPSSTPNIMLRLPIGEAGKQLQWSDFDRFKDCYFGVLVKGSNNAMFQTSTSTLGAGDVGITLKVNSLSAGTYTVIPVISTIASSTPTKDDVYGTFYTVPYTSITTLSVISSSLSITVYGRKETGNTVKMWFAITNSSSSAQTLSNNAVYLLSRSKDVSDTLESGEVRRSIPNLTVAANSTLTYSYESNSNLIFTNVPTMLYNSCKVWVTLNSGSYKNGVEPILNIEI